LRITRWIPSSIEPLKASEGSQDRRRNKRRGLGL
jgi:hypothetical protein